MPQDFSDSSLGSVQCRLWHGGSYPSWQRLVLLFGTRGVVKIVQAILGTQWLSKRSSMTLCVRTTPVAGGALVGRICPPMADHLRD